MGVAQRIKIAESLEISENDIKIKISNEFCQHSIVGILAHIIE